MKFIVALSFLFVLFACAFATTSPTTVVVSPTTVTTGTGTRSTTTSTESTTTEEIIVSSGTSCIKAGANGVAPALVNLAVIGLAAAAYAAF